MTTTRKDDLVVFENAFGGEYKSLDGAGFCSELSPTEPPYFLIERSAKMDETVEDDEDCLDDFVL